MDTEKGTVAAADYTAAAAADYTAAAAADYTAAMVDGHRETLQHCCCC